MLAGLYAQSHSLKLGHFILLPVDRYKMYLEEVVKLRDATEGNHPDKAHLINATAKLNTKISEIDHLVEDRSVSNIIVPVADDGQLSCLVLIRLKINS